MEEANKPRELDDSRRRTKIVASLGPASWSDDMLAKMIQALDDVMMCHAQRGAFGLWFVQQPLQAGTDIFRLNCSHRRGAGLSLASGAFHYH